MKNHEIIAAGLPAWIVRLAGVDPCETGDGNEPIDLDPVIARAIFYEITGEVYGFRNPPKAIAEVIPITSDGSTAGFYCFEIFALTTEAITEAVTWLLRNLLAGDLGELERAGVRWGSSGAGVAPTVERLLARSPGDGWIGTANLPTGDEWRIGRAEALARRLSTAERGEVLDQLTPVARSMVTSVEGSAASERAGRRDTAG